MRRRDLLKHLAPMAGSAVEVEDPRNGWPGILRVEGLSAHHRIAAHVGPVTLSHRDRDEVERRFQNPGQGKPLTSPAGTFPVLLGIWEAQDEGGPPVVVGMEVTDDRMTKETRQSLFIPLNTLREAQALGWSDHVSTSDEHIAAFHPSLLPVYVGMRHAGVSIPGGELSYIARAAGLGDGKAGEPAEERARRAAEVLVRNASFSKRVVEAYDGLCAMCGLDFGLLEGAHIFPVSAPGSPDEVWNGLALCRNHHGAFDRHRLWVDPMSHEVRWHPKILEQADRNPTCRAFVDGTGKTLRAPVSKQHTPRPAMLVQRYDYYEKAYDWAG